MNLLDRNEAEILSLQQQDDYFDRPLIPRWTFIVFGVICVIVILSFVGVLAWPTFRASQLARGAEAAMRRADFERALELIDQAVKLRPKEPKYLYLRGALRHGVKRYEEAIADLQQSAEAGFKPLSCYRFMALAAKNLEQLDRMVEFHELERKSAHRQYDQMSALNNLAYARSLAGKRLEQGVQEVNQALKIVASNKRRREYSSQMGAYLDTRGFLYYKLGKLKLALADMNQAVAFAENDLKAYRQSNGRNPVKRQLAVLLYHRMLILEKLKQPLKAKQDRDRIEELGFHPGKHLS